MFRIRRLSLTIVQDGVGFVIPVPYGADMKAEQLAKVVAASLARHQSRGLVDGAAGMADVVIHGRINLLAVADDLVSTSMMQSKVGKRSWATWFAFGVARRRDDRRQDRKRERLIEGIECGSTEAGIALSRLKLREGKPDPGSVA